MKQIRQNKVAFILILGYLAVLICISCVAIYFSYKQKQGELIAEMDLTLMQMATEYQDITDNFWQLYMPIFEDVGNVYADFQEYYKSEPNHLVTPQEHSALLKSLSQIAVRDNHVKWIVMYSEKREQNYIFIVDQKRLMPLEGDFPFLSKIQEKNQQMEIYGIEEFEVEGLKYDNFAICGGIPERMGEGKVLVGYSTSKLERIYKNNSIALDSLNFYIQAGDSLIYSSSSEYKEVPADVQSGRCTIGDSDVYVKISENRPRMANIACTVLWKELSSKSHGNTFIILILVLLLTIISIFLYLITIRFIMREVGIIQKGLMEIGRNNFEHRISARFHQGSFESIASSINIMTQSLQEHINRAYYYELRTKEAELAELQAKFDPHFLYNSLEIFRARCYQNNDPETADLIAQLASIFRGFIGSKTFIPIQEELAFNRRYLKLFQARYGDSVSIRYDIDTDVLKYGIVRNVFQPIIENYFVHGIDTAKEDNYILFKGRLRADTLVFKVVDNGIGMKPSQIERLNLQLHQPIAMSEESYGLRNLHQRLKLFYGGESGLSVESNKGGGITVEIVINRLECSE